MTMDKFYANCGRLLGRAHRKEGEFPAIRHIVTFTYENGTASFDGTGWVFWLEPEGV